MNLHAILVQGPDDLYRIVPIFIPMCAAKSSSLDILIFVRKLPSNVFQNIAGRIPLYLLL